MSKKLKIGSFLPLIIFIGALGLFAFGMWGNRISHDRSPLIGKAAPIAQLVGLGGENFNIGGNTAKPIVLNFFASWCAPCRAESSALLQLAQSDKIVLYGIAYRDDPLATKKFIDELGNPFKNIGIDRQGNTGALFGLSGVPETYIINRQGIIIYKHKGEVNQSDIPRIINIVQQDTSKAAK